MREVPAAVVVAIFVAALVALAGGFWDDAWHTERGRDDFFIAPHLAIYGGVAVVGGALSAWILLLAHHQGLRPTLRQGPVALAVLSVAVTLVSAPIDNAWHEAFGRDSVIWSPPHLLGIAGTLALGAAVLVELGSREERWARRAAVAAGALVLAAAGFATVEYDTDVPQFAMAFYLPVLASASAFALVLVRTALTTRWAATAAALGYTAFVALVSLFLLAAGFDAPALPLVFAAAPVVDVAWRRGLRAPVVAALYVTALHVAYVPARNALGDGVRFDAADVMVSVVLSFAAVLAVFALARMRGAAAVRGSVSTVAAGSAALVLLVAGASPAWGHDPGQGEPAGNLALRVETHGHRTELRAVLPPRLCATTRGGRVVARRAGTTIAAPLQRQGCRASGVVELRQRGRWFIYAELTGARTVESWLPIKVSSGHARAVADRSRYAYVASRRSHGAVQVVAGALLYAVMLALLGTTFWLVRRSARPSMG